MVDCKWKLSYAAQTDPSEITVYPVVAYFTNKETAMHIANLVFASGEFNQKYEISIEPMEDSKIVIYTPSGYDDNNFDSVRYEEQFYFKRKK